MPVDLVTVITMTAKGKATIVPINDWQAIGRLRAHMLNMKAGIFDATPVSWTVWL